LFFVEEKLNKLKIKKGDKNFERKKDNGNFPFFPIRA